MATENKEVVIVSQDSAESLTRAVSALFPLVKALGEQCPKINWDLADTFAENEPHQVREIMSRAFVALVNYDKAIQHEAMKGSKGKVDAKLAAVKEENLSAQATILALPEAVRKHIPAESLANWVGVPVSDLLDCFPTGCTPERAALLLKDMGVKLVQGRSAKEGLRVRLALRDEAPKPPSKADTQIGEDA
jgi:hypothetical protein